MHSSDEAESSIFTDLISESLLENSAVAANPSLAAPTAPPASTSPSTPTRCLPRVVLHVRQAPSARHGRQLAGRTPRRTAPVSNIVSCFICLLCCITSASCQHLRQNVKLILLGGELQLKATCGKQLQYINMCSKYCCVKSGSLQVERQAGGLGTGRGWQCGFTLVVQQVGDDLEAVALVDEELLALGAVVHLLCVLAHQGVEECVVLCADP